MGRSPRTSRSRRQRKIVAAHLAQGSRARLNWVGCWGLNGLTGASEREGTCTVTPRSTASSSESTPGGERMSCDGARRQKSAHFLARHGGSRAWSEDRGASRLLSRLALALRARSTELRRPDDRAENSRFLTLEFDVLFEWRETERPYIVYSLQVVVDCSTRTALIVALHMVHAGVRCTQGP